MAPSGAGRRTATPLAAVGALLVVYLVVPLVAFAVRLGASHQRGFGGDGLWPALRTSVESASIATALVAVTGIPLAHWLAGRRSRVRSAVGLAVQLPLALPPVMAGVILVYLVGPYTTLGRLTGQRLTGTVAGVVVAESFVAAPFLVVAARSAFAALDPALDDTGATLGLGPAARLARIAIPAAGPGIRAGLLLCWLRAFGEYGATVLLAYHPYSLPVYTSVQFGSAGIPDTQAPTALAVGAAAVAVAVSRLRLPRRAPPALPAGAAPSQPAGVATSPAFATRPSPAATVGFDLDVRVGTFHLVAAHRAASPRVALLGRSGAGKSMTLRAVAGLLGPVGAVEVAGSPVGHLPAERRPFGLLAQGDGLLPHRTVWEQLGLARDGGAATAAWWLRTLGIDDLAGRYPAELSGGQRRRVGLALAMCRTPPVVLLDEPSASLDTPVRDGLRRELRRLQRSVGLSTVLVTHDAEEAAMLADELVVMDAGRILQSGRRDQVMAHPASPVVASLLGIANVVAGTVAGPGRVVAGDLVVDAATADLAPGAPVRWCVRSAHVRLAAGSGATVVDRVDTGSHSIVDLAVDGGPQLRSQVPDAGALGPGDRCSVTVEPGAATAWPA